MKKSPKEKKVPPPPQIRNQNRNQKGSVCPSYQPKLSPARAEIYALLEVEGLTPTQISARRGCSKRYVRKVRLWLQNQGLLSKVPPPLSKRGGGPGTSGTFLPMILPENRRLHAQKFRVEIITSSPTYREKLNLSLTVDGNNVQCFEKVLLIQAKEKSFYGVTEDDALEKSMLYWRNFLRRLEHDLNILILKNRKQNIQMTYAEWATGPCELARKADEKGNRIMIYDSVDGKLRYTTDKSLGYEREAHHHIKGKEDSEIGNRFIEDILDHPEAPTFTELLKIVKADGLTMRETKKDIVVIRKSLFETSVLLKKAVEQNFETAAGLNAVVKLLTSEKDINGDDPSSDRPDYFG